MLVAAVEGGNDLEALDGLLLALRRKGLHTLFGVDLGPKLYFFVVEIDALDELGDCVGTHAALEVLAVAANEFAPQHFVFDDLAGEEVLELVEAPVEHVEFFLEALTDGGQVLVGGALASLDLGVLDLLFFELFDFVFKFFVTLGELEFHLFVDELALANEIGFEVFEVLVALLFIDVHNDVGGEVDDLLKLLGLELLFGLGAHEQVGQPRTGTAEVPDVHGRSGKLDVAHALAADLRAGDLDATTLADDALEPDTLVLPAVALPVLGGAEDLLAEESVLLRLEGSVVDGFWLLDFAVGPHTNGICCCESDSNLAEVIDVEHMGSYA